MKNYRVTATIEAVVTAKDEDDAIATVDAGLERLSDSSFDDETYLDWVEISGPAKVEESDE